MRAYGVMGRRLSKNLPLKLRLRINFLKLPGQVTLKSLFIFLFLFSGTVFANDAKIMCSVKHVEHNGSITMNIEMKSGLNMVGYDSEKDRGAVILGTNKAKY
jgi:hypothetical protein